MKILLIVTLVFANSKAFEVVVVNEADIPIIPQVQALGSSTDASDQHGYLLPGNDRAYDNADDWLNTPAMSVTEGDTRTMSISANGVEIPCGSVKFTKGTVVTFKDGECTTSAMPLIDSDTNYSFWIDIPAYSWIVTGYADGPDTYTWVGAIGKSTITFHAVEHTTGLEADIDTTMWRSNQCYVYYINDAPSCQGQTKTKFEADKYDSSLNPNLPPGRFSGLVKIQGQKWKNAGHVEVFYINLEAENLDF